MRAAVSVVVSVLALGCGGGAEPDNTALRARLAYLGDLAQVEWVEYEGGDVYVGFGPRPPEFQNIVNTALAVGHQAHGQSVTVWAVSGAAPGWRPTRGRALCKASAALGSVREICE